MPEGYWGGVAVAAHLIMTAAVVTYVRAGGRRPVVSSILAMLLLPGFGPVALWMLARAERRPAPDALRFRRGEGVCRSAASAAGQPPQTIPMEEARFINDPRHRRGMLLTMLKSNPRKHLDVLMAARFDEDPETAHYATATLMKIQQDMQRELQQYRARLQRDPADENLWSAYLALEDEYCASGLLEGPLLRRERLQLASALNQCLARQASPERFSMAVQNHLALAQVQRARDTAHRMYRRWPNDERSWLEMMRVYVQSHDRNGMKTLMERALNAPVDWTRDGKEKLKYWMKRSA